MQRPSPPQTRPELGPNDPVPPPSGAVQRLTAPYIDPRVTDPRALSYRRALEERKKLERPVGEVPMPPIPRLDQVFESARPMTMAEAAQQQRATEFNEHNTDGTIFQTAPSVPRLLAKDILPEAAQADPQFIPGQGAMVALNQPGLALRYGVMREGRHISPQELQHNTYAQTQQQQPRTQLRPETLAGIKQLEELQRQAQDKTAENAARESGAGAAEQLAGKEVSQTDREKLKDAVSRMDDLDFGQFREMMVRDLLNNEEQRKIIEERVKPIDISAMVMDGVAKQEVVIIPGQFSVVFQSSGGDIELALKGMIAEESKTLDYSVQYFTDKYAIMSLAVGIFSINNNPLPSHLNADGDFDRIAFLKKFKKVARLPLPMLSSLGAHYFWFDVRCRKRFVMENLKNG